MASSDGNPYDRFRKLLECSICLDVYENPKTLRCSHEYCARCLEDVMVFQRDGSVKIACPMRCTEDTVLNNDQTVKHLATSYTIKSLLDTLREDTKDDRDNNNSTTGPLCRFAEGCTKYMSVYCCGTVMCERCCTQHVDSTTADVVHRTRSLTYNTRNNKLRVLCEEHSSGCTHVCTADDELLCVYCLHRNERHKCHAKNTVETEARLLKEAVGAELLRRRSVDEAASEVVCNVREAKGSLIDVLRRRKKECMLKYEAMLDVEITRLTMKFDYITDGYVTQCKDHGGEGEMYFRNLMDKLDVEIVLSKQEILDIIDKNISKVATPQSLNVSFTESVFDSKSPLGDLMSVTGDSVSKSFFTCGWMNKSVSPNEELCLEHFAPDSLPSDVIPSRSSTEPVNDDERRLLSVRSTDACSAGENVEEIICCGTTPSVATSKLEEVVDIVDIEMSGNVKVTSTLSAPNVSSGTTSVENTDLNIQKYSVQSADDFKGEGNKYFKQKRYPDAVDCYSKAIKCCPPEETGKLSVYYQNRAATYEMMEKWENVVQDCSNAINIDNKYVKALTRRSRAYENLGLKRKSLDDVLYIRALLNADMHADMHADPNRSEIFQRQTRLLESLAMEAAMKAKNNSKLKLPKKFEIVNFFMFFNYDVFTIPTTSEDSDLNYKQIMKGMDKAKYGNVLMLCDKEIEASGKHADRARLLRGTIRQVMGDLTVSRADFDIITKFSPNHTDYAERYKLAPNRLIFFDAMVKIIQNERLLGNFVNALNILSHARRDLEPNNATLECEHGQILYHMGGEREKSREAFQKACSLDTSFIAPRLHLLSAFSDRNERKYADIVSDFPLSVKAWCEYARFLNTCGRMKEAMEKLDKAISLEPSNPQPVWGKITFLFQNSRQDEAEKVLQEMIKTFKEITTHQFFMLGVIKLQKGNFDLAVNLLEKAAQKLPDPLANVEEVFKICWSSQEVKSKLNFIKCANNVFGPFGWS